MKTSVIGIDLGTQGVKVIVYDFKKKDVVHSASAPLELISRTDGTREQLAEWWVQALHDCFDALPEAIKRNVAAIGVSGQQHGFVPLDKNGKVLTPVKLWCDTSTDKECKEIINDAGGDEAYAALTGMHLKTGYTASKIRWLRDHHPETYQQLATILLPHDYINYYLTGNFSMECGDASGTGLLDIRNRCWSHELIKRLDSERDLTTCLPPLIDAHEKSGFVRPELAKAIGLSGNVIVSAGGGDNMMAAIGTGNIGAGELTASLGTSGTLFAYSDTAIIDTQGDLAAFCSSTGGWLPLLCTMNCTIATEQIRKLLKINEGSLDALAGQIAIGADGVFTLPFYNGERTPNLPNSKALITGLDQTNTSAAHLVRSAMESAIFGLKNGITAFSRCGLTFREVTLTGGGSKSPLWRQMCADILNLRVRVMRQPENAAFGAAMQALWCLNHENGAPLALHEITGIHLSDDEHQACKPDPESARKYESIYQRYLTLIDTVKPLYQ